MIVWRIARRKYAALDGRGGLVEDGRWHSRGIPVVYGAANASLCVLEVRVNTTVSPVDYVLIEIFVPDDLIVDVNHWAGLPLEWRTSFDATRAVGDRWLRLRASACLRVPSAVVPVESNYLLNPLHPKFSRIEALSAVPFQFDVRLYQ